MYKENLTIVERLQKNANLLITEEKQPIESSRKFVRMQELAGVRKLIVEGTKTKTNEGFFDKIRQSYNAGKEEFRTRKAAGERSRAREEAADKREKTRKAIEDLEKEKQETPHEWSPEKENDLRLHKAEHEAAEAAHKNAEEARKKQVNKEWQKYIASKNIRYKRSPGTEKEVPYPEVEPKQETDYTTDEPEDKDTGTHTHKYTSPPEPEAEKKTKAKSKTKKTPPEPETDYTSDDIDENIQEGDEDYYLPSSADMDKTFGDWHTISNAEKTQRLQNLLSQAEEQGKYLHPQVIDRIKSKGDIKIGTAHKDIASSHNEPTSRPKTSPEDYNKPVDENINCGEKKYATQPPGGTMSAVNIAEEDEDDGEDTDFDADDLEQIKIGIETELDAGSTNDAEEALQIAMRNVKKDKKYYMKNKLETEPEEKPLSVEAIREAITEVKAMRHLYVESAPPGFPEKLMYKLKAQYPGNTGRAFATAWMLHKKGIADENYELTEADRSYRVQPEDLPQSHQSSWTPDEANGDVDNNIDEETIDEMMKNLEEETGTAAVAPVSTPLAFSSKKQVIEKDLDEKKE